MCKMGELASQRLCLSIGFPSEGAGGMNGTGGEGGPLEEVGPPRAQNGTPGLGGNGGDGSGILGPGPGGGDTLSISDDRYVC